MTQYKRLRLAVPLAVAVAALWMTPQSQQPATDTKAQPSRLQRKIPDVNNFPIAEFSTPKSNDPKRNARGEKYDKSHWRVNPNVVADSTVSVDKVDFNLPAIPVEKAAAIVVGTVTHAQAYLSNDKTGVYSSFAVSIDEILKNPGNLAVGISIEVEREGGRVKFPSGRVHLYLISEQDMPRAGRQYVLFLTATDISLVFEIMTGYEIRNGSVYALDDLPQPRSRDNTPAAEFMNELRTRVASH